MNKQILRLLSISILTLTVVLTTAVASANGQTSQRVSAQIPFDFVVGDKTLRAGEYTLSSTTQDGSALMIRNAKAKDAAFRLTSNIHPRGSKKSHTRLVFHRYGQTYFLAEVWQSGQSNGRALSASKAERELKRQRASVAQNSYETVELVARLR